VEVVDLLFANPIIAARTVERALGVTNQGAHNLIRQLERRGWLRQLPTVGRGGRNLWLAAEIFAAVEDPRPASLPRRGSDQVTMAS
jgi:DNA-binding IclR family transcriptional regulator